MTLSPRRIAAVVAAFAALLSLSACGSSAQPGAVDPGKPLVVIADAEPHTTLLKQVETLGLLGDTKLDIKELTGQIDANQLVQSGDVDANFFQHVPYLKDWNTQNQGTLISVADVHIEPLGLYSQKVASLAEVPEGATIAIPSDPTNLARALFLLADAQLITLDVAADDPNLDFTTVTAGNITANPKNVTFVEIDRPQLFATLADPKVHLSVINGNYALEGGLKPATDALALEKAENNPYVNVLVVRPELKDDPRVVKLAAALGSPEIAEFITNTYAGSVLPAKG